MKVLTGSNPENPIKMFIALREGSEYQFEVKGSTTLPDGRKYVKLLDPNGYKHLLLLSDYTYYNLLERKKVLCYVSKINCSGRIFLEPENPHYFIGKVYNFVVTGIDQSGKIPLIRLKDFFDRQLEVSSIGMQHIPSAGDTLECRIDRIKKGKLLLIPPGLDNSLSHLDYGAKYSFLVEDEIEMNLKEIWYILSWGEGKFRLRKKFYEKYGFNTGQTIECKVAAIGNTKYPEPENPVYTVGETYPFKILREESIFEYPDKKKELFVLENQTGKDIYIEKDLNSKGLKPGDFINCKVESILSGQHILSSNL